MGVEAGPNIINSGLVLSLDASNIRSFPGEPTTNLANTDSARTFFTHADSTVTFASAPERGERWKKMTITARGANFRVAQFPYLTQNANTTRTYTVEIDYGSTSGYFIRGDGFTGFGSNNSSNGVCTITRTNSGTGGVLALFLNHNSTGVSGISDTIYYRDYQVEDLSYATPFTESSRSATGGWKDLTTNNYHGDLANGPTYNSSNGGSIVFDGSNDTVNLPASSLTTTQNFTAEAWVKLSLRGDRHIVLVNWTGWAIEVGQSGSALYPYFTWWNGSAQLSTTWNLTATVGGWTHLCATFDGSTARIYVNGTQSAQYNSTTISYGVYARQISGTTFSGPILGNVASVRNYNVALTAAEVLQNFNATRARFGI